MNTHDSDLDIKTNFKLSAALAWSERGFHVFPIRPNGKEPAISGWTESASRDPVQILKWWTESPHSNIGCLTSDWIVADLDVKNGKRGFDSWEALRLGFDSLTVATPSGGRHVYFWGPQSSNAVDLLGAQSGLDIRSFNGYTLAPGSTIEGVPYTIEVDAEPTFVPDVLLPLLRPPGTRNRRGSNEIDDDSDLNIKQAIDYLVHSAPVAIEGQGGDSTTFGVCAYLVRDLGLSEPMALELLLRHWNDRCSPSWDERALETKLSNAAMYGQAEKGGQSIERVLGTVDFEALSKAMGEGPDAEAAESKAKGRYKTLSAYIAEFEPVRYLVEPVITAGYLYTLTGKSGAGKTAFLTALSLALASGNSDILGLPSEAGRVMYATFENTTDFRMKLLVALHAYGINAHDLDGKLDIIDASMGPGMVKKQLELATAATGDNFSLCVVDTYAAAFDGQDMNNPTQAKDFIRRWRPITTLPGLPAVLIATHPTKNASEDSLVPSGAGSVLNEVDGNLTLWGTAKPSPEKDGGCQLFWQGKIRGTFVEPIHFPLSLTSAPHVLHIHGKTVPVPVLLPKGGKPSEAAREKADIQNRHILAILVNEPMISQRALAAATGINGGSIGRRLKNLENKKLIKVAAGKCIVTPLGKKAAEFPEALSKYDSSKIPDLGDLASYGADEGVGTLH